MHFVNIFSTARSRWATSVWTTKSAPRTRTPRLPGSTSTIRRRPCASTVTGTFFVHHLHLFLLFFSFRSFFYLEEAKKLIIPSFAFPEYESHVSTQIKYCPFTIYFLLGPVKAKFQPKFNIVNSQKKNLLGLGMDVAAGSARAVSSDAPAPTTSWAVPCSPSGTRLRRFWPSTGVRSVTRSSASGPRGSSVRFFNNLFICHDSKLHTAINLQDRAKA